MHSNENQSKENKTQVLTSDNKNTSSNESDNSSLASANSTAVKSNETPVQKSAAQNLVNNSPQVSQFKANQELANESPQIEQANAQHQIANGGDEGQDEISGSNNTGLPAKLKAGIESLSGLSMDDVTVHYNSNKPAQMQAHAFAQGTEIHLAAGQEKHLPHEAWHVVQQKQGRVKTLVQVNGENVNDDKSLEKEADLMGAKALQEPQKELPQLQHKKGQVSNNIHQLQITIEGSEVPKDELLDVMIHETNAHVHHWLTTDGMTAIVKANSESKKMKEEISATESNSKATKYLQKHLPTHIDELLTKYDLDHFKFSNSDEIRRQLVQDVKLRILKLDNMVGVEQNAGQFSTSDDSGRGKPLRIYRTTTRGDWNNYLRTQDVNDLLHGHGGSFGQALDYYYKSKNADKTSPLFDNIIFELQFENTASNAIDYSEITKGGEGGGPKGGKLTGKSEKNDIFKEANVFSVNLSACSRRIIAMDPVVSRVDELKGDDSQFSKRLLELGLKHESYPPTAEELTESEQQELVDLTGL